MDESATISATRFRATCLGLLDRLASGEIERLAVTKRGKVVAVVESPAGRRKVDALFGALKGDTRRPDGLDLTAPVLEGVIEAQHGATGSC